MLESPWPTCNTANLQYQVNQPNKIWIPNYITISKSSYSSPPHPGWWLQATDLICVNVALSQY